MAATKVFPEAWHAFTATRGRLATERRIDLLKRPEVLAQEAVAEPDRIADDAGERCRVVSLCQRARHPPPPPGPA